jgi:hypothetical protein
MYVFHYQQPPRDQPPAHGFAADKSQRACRQKDASTSMVNTSIMAPKLMQAVCNVKFNGKKKSA